MKSISKVNFYMKLAGGWGISRRYFVLNGFDGVLTVFGVVVGAFLLQQSDPRFVILPGIGAAFAIGVSGFWIAYLTETAELSLKQTRLEKQLFANLDDSAFAKASKFSTVVNSIINGVSPFSFGFAILIPFILAQLEIIEMDNAYFYSITIAFFLLFFLGFLLGKIADQSKTIFGVKTIFAGVIVAIFMVITGI